MTACVEDPESEHCNIATAEYCAAHSDESACALLIPRFLRYAKEESHMSLHADVSVASAKLGFTSIDCECGKTCTNGASFAVTSQDYDIASSYLELRFTSPHVGSFKLCNLEPSKEATLANFEFIVANCEFEGTTDTPCSSAACADETSEECQHVKAEYCMNHPYDGGCDVVVAVFRRPEQKLGSVKTHVRWSSEGDLD